MVYLWIAIAIVLFCMFLAYTLLFRNNILQNYSKINVIKKTQSGINYFMQNGVPFHTHFNEKTNTKYVINDAWEFWTKGSEQKETVNLPHCFNTPDSPHRFYNGSVFYTKNLDLSSVSSKTDEHIHLVFNGSFYTTRVWLDDVYLGENIGGYNQFRFDITSIAKTKESAVLKVEVNNTLNSVSIPPELYKGHALGWHAFGGLHKDVYLEVCPKVYAFKCHAVTIDVLSSPKVRVNMLFHNPMGEVIDEFNANVKLMFKGKKLAEQSVKIIAERLNSEIYEAFAEFDVADAKLWSFESPNLYNIEVETEFEKYSVNFGFKDTRTVKDEIHINGEKTLFKGACAHEEDPENGLAQSKESMAKDYELLEDLGANFVRLSHYPHHPYFLDMCDKNGMYAWEEIPLYQAGLGIIKYYSIKSNDDRESKLMRFLRIPGKVLQTRQLTYRKLVKNACIEIARMIERDFNHPSIAFWGIGNECWSFTGQGAKTLKKLKGFVKELDTSRVPAYALMTMRYKGVSKKFERSLKVMDVVAINEYFGWYYGKPSDVEGFLSEISSSMKGKPFIISETGADCVYGEHTEDKNPSKGYSEEYQAYLLSKQYDILKKTKGFAGISVWVLKDFYCPEYKTDNPIPYYNLKGIASKDREKKQAFYTLKKLYMETNE